MLDRDPQSCDQPTDAPREDGRAETRRQAVETAARLAVAGPLLAILLDPRRVEAYGFGNGDEDP